MTSFFGVKIQKPQPLVDAIRSVVSAKRRPVAARDRVYASEISNCDRRITFALLGCEPDAPRSDSPSALLGDAIHAHLEALLKEAFPGRVETEVRDYEIEEPIRVSKWVRKPPRLDHPAKNGKVSNLYKTLAGLYGVSVMSDEQLQNAEEFVQNAVGREYQLTIETKPSGWYEIVHIAPVRKARNRKKEEDEEVPF